MSQELVERLTALRTIVENAKNEIWDISLKLLEAQHGYNEDEAVILNGKPGRISYPVPADGCETGPLRVMFPSAKGGRALYRFVKEGDTLTKAPNGSK